ncbi:MAG: molybdopterin-dependent oxidoreductase [Sneathiellales bacterium]|nr:molybdopterin-dependent oxidoreductase [Sneathiellales bacterium]
MLFICNLSRLALVSLIAIIAITSSASALEKATGAILLKVSGKVSTVNTADGTAVFDRNLLNSFERKSIRTKTPWTNGVIHFEGFLVRDLLSAIGVESGTVRAVAINEYMIEIPIEDFLKYDVIIADHKNGTPMTVREKGPLWIIYPWDSDPELVNEIYHARSIWQLRSLIIE